MKFSVALYKSTSRIRQTIRTWWLALRFKQQGLLIILGNRLLRLRPNFRAGFHPPYKRVYQREIERSRLKPMIISVYPNQTIKNRPPLCIYDQIKNQFISDCERSVPENHCMTIPHGRSWGDAIVITAENSILKDVSKTYMKEQDQNRKFSSKWITTKNIFIEGQVANISVEAGQLYYHWIHQVLPRIHLLEKAGFKVSNLEKIIVNKLDNSFQRETLEIIGIPKEKLLFSSYNTQIHASQMIVPSIPVPGGNFQHWAIDYIRENVLKYTNCKNKEVGLNLYISRKKASYRRIINESELIGSLRQKNFMILLLEDMPFLEQARIFSNAGLIISPHGGGLSNLVFCKRGTTVIEIFSPELVATMYWKLSNVLGLQYYYVLGKGEPSTRRPDYCQSWNARSDIIVDISELELTLAKAGVR